MEKIDEIITNGMRGSWVCVILYQLGVFHYLPEVIIGGFIGGILGTILFNFMDTIKAKHGKNKKP